MNVKKWFWSFLLVFAVALAASIVVTFLWSLGFHETASIDWETSFQLAIILGIIIPLADIRKK
jgi:uncharacterized membrane protein YesL